MIHDNKAKKNPALYLLTNDDAFALLYQKLEIALASQVFSVLQIRRKQVLLQSDGASCLYDEAQAIIELANRHQVQVVMNDDIQLAQRLQVGVHLGQQDGCVLDAREKLGKTALIGRTCHQDIKLLEQAYQDGASYAAMGAVFTSPTKPKAAKVSMATLKQAVQYPIDVCVIGGLTINNVQALTGIPIRYLAVVSDVLNRPIEQIPPHCQKWREVLSNW